MPTGSREFNRSEFRRGKSLCRLANSLDACAPVRVLVAVKRKILTGALLVMAVAIAEGSGKISGASEKDVVENVFGGKRVFDAFSEAQTVQVQRIHQGK